LSLNYYYDDDDEFCLSIIELLGRNRVLIVIMTSWELKI